MPCEEPPADYLAQAELEFTPLEQAKSTWKHYFGAGLPQQGVERLYAWLLQRARERKVQTSQLASRSGPRGTAPPQDEVRAYTAIQPQGDHVRFAAEHGLDLNAIVSKLSKDPKAKRLSTPQQWSVLTTLLERAAGVSQQRAGGAA